MRSVECSGREAMERAKTARARGRRERAGRDRPGRGRSWIGLIARGGVASLAGAALLALAPTPARAHGPTVEIRASGLSPALLNLFVGTTVHFANTTPAPDGVVVLIDEAGKIRSPLLKAPGDGWHHTFEATGRYSIRLEQRPDAKMTIVVVPKR